VLFRSSVPHILKEALAHLNLTRRHFGEFLVISRHKLFLIKPQKSRMGNMHLYHPKSDRIQNLDMYL